MLLVVFYFSIYLFIYFYFQAANRRLFEGAEQLHKNFLADMDDGTLRQISPDTSDMLHEFIRCKASTQQLLSCYNAVVSNDPEQAAAAYDFIYVKNIMPQVSAVYGARAAHISFVLEGSSSMM